MSMYLMKIILKMIQTKGSLSYMPSFALMVSDYFTSAVSYSQALPASIDFESLLFIGEEVNTQVEILIFDDDEATTEDFIGSTTFVPSDFLLQRNRRETVQGGFLELDLILKWECGS